MKHLVLIATLLLVSCTVSFQPSTRVFLVSGFDFTEYAEKGFLFTPHQYSGDYESRGIISIMWVPATAEDRPGESGWVRKRIVGVTAGDAARYYWEEELDPDMVIQSAYQAATKLDADALINFKIQEYNVERGGVAQVGYTVSGFAIKRK